MIDKNKKAFLILIVLNISLIILFFGRVLIDVNNHYFAAHGDGIQTYHEILYHVKHDTSYFESKSMQYPYGDNAFFSVNPLMLANLIKIVDRVVPIADYTIGIFNVFVIFSILLASICLYFIFIELNINAFYAVLFASIISFLSPQIMRFGGHNSLGYVFAIPAFILFLFKTWKNPTYIKSILIALYVFFISGNHLYYLGFFLLVASLYYALQLIFFKTEQKYSLRKRIIHYTIEIILPLIILKLLIDKIHPAVDRTEFPWNFFYCLGKVSGLYYPEYSFYRKLFDLFIKESDIIWESRSYIGIVAVLGSVILFLSILKNILNFKFKEVFYFDENSNIVILFYISIIAVIVSVGFPFTTGWGRPLFDLISAIKQFRAISRFNWIYFYGINIVVFTLLYQLILQKKKTRWLNVLVVLLIFINIVDIYTRNKNLNEAFANKIIELEDKDNNTEYNAWLTRTNIGDYQAIIGLPYFSLGSENIYMGDDSYGMRNAMLYSIKTGLPTFNLHSNRTPLQETFNTIELILEPYNLYTDFDRFTSDKAFLVLCDKSKELKSYEKRLINHASLIDSSLNMYIYKLPFDYFKNGRIKYVEELKQIENDVDSGKYIFLDYEHNNFASPYKSTGALEHPCEHYLTLYEGKVPNSSINELDISYWVGNIHTDVILRGTYIIELFDKNGRLYLYKEGCIGKSVSVLDGDWALIEDKVLINDSNDKIKITLINRDISGKMNRIDNLLIKPADSNVVFDLGQFKFVNNRLIK